MLVLCKTISFTEKDFFKQKTVKSTTEILKMEWKKGKDFWHFHQQVNNLTALGKTINVKVSSTTPILEEKAEWVNGTTTLEQNGCKLIFRVIDWIWKIIITF